MLLKRQPLTPLHVPLPSLGALLLGREATVVKGVNDIKRIDLWKRQRGRIYMGDVKTGGRRAVKTAALLPCLTPPLPSSVALLLPGK